MFDAIAPRYDLVNRIMTFRLDVRWRRRPCELLALPPRSTVLDLASGTGDLCVDLARAGHRPLSFDLSIGMLRRRPQRRATRSRPTSCGCRCPTRPSTASTCGFALRNLVELPAFFDELGRVVRPGGRIALLDVGVPHNSVVRWGNDIYFGKVVPRIGGWLSDGRRTATCPKSVAYLPAPSEMLATLRAAGFADADHDQLTGGITQLLLGHAADAAPSRAVSRAATSPSARPQRHRQRRRLPVRPRRRRRRRPGRRRTGCRSTRSPTCSPSIDHDDATACDVPGRWRSGAVPFKPGTPGELVVPAVVPAQDADGRRWVTTIDVPTESLGSAAPAGTVARRRFTIEPVTPVDDYLAAVVAARDAVRDGRLTKAVIAREIAVEADRPIDVHARAAPAARRRSGRATATRSTASIGASPELLVEVDGQHRASRTRSPARHRAPATVRLDAEHRRRTCVASTKNQVEHRVVIDMVHDTLLPWCSYLDWEPEPSIVTVANVQHLGTRDRGAAVDATARRPRARARPVTDAGARRAPAGRGAGVDRRGRGLRSRSLRRRCRLGRRRRQRHVGGRDPLRRAVRRTADAPDCVAGGGIVADSDPLAELAETQAKFQAMLSALIRP